MKNIDKINKQLIDEIGKLNAKIVELKKIKIERDYAEEAQQESEAKYFKLFDNMLDGFALHEIVLNNNNVPIDYIFIDINDAFENQTGLKREKIIGKNVTKVLPDIEHDPAGWIERYGKVALKGKSIRFENYSEQLKKWYSVSAYSPQKGYFATIFQDITERKQTEENLKAMNQQLIASEQQLRAANQQLIAHGKELRESEYQLKETQEIAGLGSYVLDISSGIWKSSSILDNIFGLDKKYKKDISGWLQISHPEDKTMMQDYFATNVLINHELFNKEYRIKRINDQQERWVHGMGKLEFNDDEDPIKMIGTIQDITERKRVEEKLINRNKELELFNEVTVDRELKMIELKKEINELLEKSGKMPKYKIIV